MSKRRTLTGYLVVTIVLIVALIFLSQAEASPWLNAVAVAIAIWAAKPYVETLSVLAVVAIVGALTALLPLALLFAMGRDSGLSPLPYLGVSDAIEMTLPTLTAAVIFVFLKRTKGSKAPLSN